MAETKWTPEAVRLAPALATPLELSLVGRYVINDAWVMEQKLDGHRILMVAGDTPVFLNRDGTPYSKAIPKALASDHGVAEGYVIDGELVDKTLWAFDVLHVDGSLDARPLTERRTMLESLIHPDSPIKIVPQARTTASKERLLMEAASRGLEGVILKRADSRYDRGNRSPNWLKAKFVVTAEVVVLAVRDDGKESASLGMVSGSKVIEVGRCSLIGKPNVIPGDVVEVRYLYALNPARPRLYQPTLLRVRTDKSVEECTLDQLRFTNKTVMEAIA